MPSEEALLLQVHPPQGTSLISRPKRVPASKALRRRTKDEKRRIDSLKQTLGTSLRRGGREVSNYSTTHDQVVEWKSTENAMERLKEDTNPGRELEWKRDVGKALREKIELWRLA